MLSKISRDLHTRWGGQGTEGRSLWVWLHRGPAWSVEDHTKGILRMHLLKIQIRTAARRDDEEVEGPLMDHHILRLLLRLGVGHALHPRHLLEAGR